jgi:hypothetical protein
MIQFVNIDGGSSNSIASGLSIILLFIALSIFIWLAIRSKGITNFNFQFQISLFIIIWILGEIIGILQEYKTLIFAWLPDISLQIHLLSMIFLSVILWIRFLNSERGQKRIIDDISDKNGLQS